jgi:predicted methyltransferase
MRILLPLLACLAPLPLAAVPAAMAQTEAAQADPALEPILAHPRRADDRDRDEFRHPAETLAFMQVRPGMTVVDYTPGGGWWTRVLVPYLGESGRYIALNPAVGQESPMARYYANTATTFPPRATEWTGVPADRIGAYNTDGVPEDLNGTVDRVLMFRAMHNLFRSGMLHRELTAIRALLKPDGLLGIEQHRAAPDAPAAYTDGSKGYLREQDVIGLVEAHGFELVGKSEINANPKDSADHPEGVWELPPNLRTKREELKTIGESDRMTLLFRKRA